MSLVQSVSGWDEKSFSSVSAPVRLFLTSALFNHNGCFYILTHTTLITKDLM